MNTEWFITHIVEFALTGLCAGFVVYVRNLHKQYKAIAEGTQALLRESIVNSYRYFKAKGYCDPEERIVLAKTYTAYHELGGNDVATDLYEKIRRLPAEDTAEPGYVEEEIK